jgi:hypothetical protein
MADLNNITYRRYDPVGRCIYCGAVGVELTEEHIIPFALAGRAVLPAASCKTCEKETGRMEQHCCHTMLNRMRFYLKIPSKKHGRKQRPIKFTFIDHNDVQRTVWIPVAENPLGLLLPTFPPMRHLSNEHPASWQNEPEIGHWRYGPPDAEAQALMAKHRAKAASTDLDALLFARQVAKIGFAFAAAESGIESFTPVITDLILGKSANWHRFVGSGLTTVPLNSRNELHSILVENYDIRGVTYHMATVTLFSRFGAPSYSVALGTVSDEQYQRMLARVEDRARRFGKIPGRAR